MSQCFQLFLEFKLAIYILFFYFLHIYMCVLKISINKRFTGILKLPKCLPEFFGSIFSAVVGVPANNFALQFTLLFAKTFSGNGWEDQ